MKQIPLTQGKIAIVDDANYEWLSRFKGVADWETRQDQTSLYD